MGRIARLVALATVSFAVVACGSSPATNPAGPAGSGEPAPAGHVHGAPPPPAAPLRAGETFLTVGLSRPYQPAPPAGGTDEYRCFLIDPKLTADTYITGNQFLPQNAEIVHHAIIYSVKPSTVEHARQVDSAADGDGWQCFGGAGLGDDLEGFGGRDTGVGYIGGWAPGHNETLLGGIAGHRLAAGSQLVLQLHYNLLSTKGQPGPTDQSTTRLRVLPGTADVTPLTALRLPAPIELPCAENESGELCDRDKAIADLTKRTGNQARTTVEGLNYLCNKGAKPTPGNTQHCDIPVRTPVLVYAAAPHMHLLGRAMTVEVNPGTPGARMLLNEPGFSFDDQSNRILPEPVRLNRGDTLRVSCTHDASVRAHLPELKTLQPRYVVWGDGTSDEMCLATLTATTKL